jgi:uncharacterized protein (TIGR00730 family)
MPSLRRVCVFCGSSPGAGDVYVAAARALGDALADRGLGLVYGGAQVGLMGTVADAVLARGGEVVGVLPEALQRREIRHDGLTELHLVGTMHERKAMMADLADAFVALPGGLGTLEEVVEAATWTQLGIHQKPVGLLDSAGYWAPFGAFLDHAVEAGFVRAEHRRGVVVDADPEPLLARLEAWAPAHVEKWLDLGQS